MQAQAAAAFVFGVIAREHGTKSIEMFVLMNVLCPFPKVAGQVKILSSSMRIIISYFNGANFCSFIDITFLLFYGSQVCFFFFFLLAGHLDVSICLCQQ